MNVEIHTEKMKEAEAILEFIQVELLRGDESMTVSLDEDLLGSGLVDSLGIMRLVSFIENKYSTAVPPEDVTIDNFLNVQAVAAYVSGKTASP